MKPDERGDGITMAQKIEIVRGATETFAITITGANNALYALASGEVLVFGVKKNPAKDAELLIKKTVTSGNNGVYTIKISPEDTSELPFGNYFYDVGVKSGNDFYPVIEASQFVIRMNVTKRGDAS